MTERPRRWRTAMADALYGPSGFFVAGSTGRAGPARSAGPASLAGPAGHFRTSAHASALFAAAVLRLVCVVDEALGHPPRLDVVDVGAGGGELLRGLAGLAAPELRDRLRLVGVDLAPRPVDLPAPIGWASAVPAPVTGLLVATEWLDNVPLDVAVMDESERPRYVLVDRTGRESLGPPLDDADDRWLRRWWPGGAGARIEIGRTRDEAWASAVAAITTGLAVCVDYGHRAADRPPFGTLTGFREGREVAPVPDGSTDLTAHVAIDAVAAAGSAVAGGAAPVLLRQRAALPALGVSGARPPLALASRDPAGYVRALAAASQAAELTDPAGLGGHFWLVQPVGLAPQSVTRWLSQ